MAMNTARKMMAPKGEQIIHGIRFRGLVIIITAIRQGQSDDSSIRIHPPLAG